MAMLKRANYRNVYSVDIQEVKWVQIFLVFCVFCTFKNVLAGLPWRLTVVGAPFWHQKSGAAILSVWKPESRQAELALCARRQPLVLGSL